jgi:hypothetical protein
MDRFEPAFRPLLDEIEQRSSVAGRFVDKIFRIYIATLWANWRSIRRKPASASTISKRCTTT